MIPVNCALKKEPANLNIIARMVLAWNGTKQVISQRYLGGGVSVKLKDYFVLVIFKVCPLLESAGRL